jgi:hypothetical protein
VFNLNPFHHLQNKPKTERQSPPLPFNPSPIPNPINHHSHTNNPPQTPHGLNHGHPNQTCTSNLITSKSPPP